jgi:hypothetical protein
MTSLLLLDIKEAFDAVIHQRLFSHLRLQGWDNSLIQLIQDWLSGRSVSVQIGNAIATDLIKDSLPQGFSLSPILFLLYAAIVVPSIKPFLIGNCYLDLTLVIWTSRYTKIGR